MIDGVPLLVGYGGGVNSLAVVIGLRDRKIVPDLITFADTGDEKPETYAYLGDVLPAWLAKNGFPALTRVRKNSPRTGDVSLEAECLRRETMPSRAFGLSSCAMRWKIEPQEKFLNNWAPARRAWEQGKKPIKILGYDDGEAGRRDKITEDAKLRYWYPLIEWGLDRDGCVELIRNEGLPIPPKSACFYCPSSTKSEVLELGAKHPELLARALHMEQVALASDKHELRTVKGLGRQWAWSDLVRLDEAGRKHLREAPVEPCMICEAGE